MQFTTTFGQTWIVDLKNHTFHTNDGVPPLPFHKVVGVYVGSPGVEFLDADGNLIFDTSGVVSTLDVPADNVSGEDGNVVFRTENSCYEVDQEQKLIRRLTGTNSPTSTQGLDGEWRTYEHINTITVGQHVLIYYYQGFTKATRTSIVREVKGHFVESPHVPFTG